MEHLDTSPVTITDQNPDVNNPTLSKVKGWVQSGWPDQERGETVELQPYARRYELSIEEGCFVVGETSSSTT